MRKRLYDIGVSVAIIGAAGLVYWDALKYRPGIYDPLGSGTMPRMVAVAIVVLSIVAIVQALLARASSCKACECGGRRRLRPPALAGLQHFHLRHHLFDPAVFPNPFRDRQFADAVRVHPGDQAI